MANRHDELQTMLRELKLPTMATVCSQLALKAAKEGLSHEAFLYELARLEREEQANRRMERCLKQSKLPREKTFQGFRLERMAPSLRVQIERLKSGAFVEQAYNVLLVGPPGVGKSHLAAALGYELIKQGHPTLWTTTAALVQRLLVAKRALSLPQEIARLDRFHCLILDDIGYVQQDRDEMDVLFTMLAERYERRSLMITTNLVFSEWQRIFKDPMTTLAAVDRVVHHCVLLDLTGVESFRAQEARSERLQEKQADAVTVQEARKDVIVVALSRFDGCRCLEALLSWRENRKEVKSVVLYLLLYMQMYCSMKTFFGVFQDFPCSSYARSRHV